MPGLQVTNPWSLETVSSFMAAKYRAERATLSQAALSSYLHRRMTHEQLCRAMDLALDSRSREWALLIRFALTWMSSSARRAADVRYLVYSALCTYEARHSTARDPWVKLLCKAVLILSMWSLIVKCDFLCAGWSRPRPIKGISVRRGGGQVSACRNV